MWKPSVLMAVLLLLASMGASVYYAFHAWVNGPLYTLTTVSPNKTYTVQLKEEMKTLSAPFSGQTTHTIHMNVHKGEQVIADVDVYGGDNYDERFQALFPEHQWISNSVLVPNYIKPSVGGVALDFHLILLKLQASETV